MPAFDWMGKDKAVKNREPGIEDAYTNIFLKRLMIYRRCCIMKMVMGNEKIHFHA